MGNTLSFMHKSVDYKVTQVKSSYTELLARKVVT